jgi:ligand-binding sensor domain-containing protein
MWRMFLKLPAMIFLLMLPSVAFAVKKVSVMGTTREIVLPAFQFDKMKQDLPIVSAVMDSGDAMWLAGKQSIWRWQLKSNQLQRIQLVKDGSGGPLREIVIHDDSLFAMTSRDLFQVKFNPLKAIRLKSNGVATKGIAMIPGGRHLYWITTSGVYAADPMQRSLMHLTNAPELAADDKAVFVWEDGRLWYSHNGKLYIRDMIASKAETREILATKQKLKAIYRSGDEIYVHTRFSVLRYDLQGKLLQTIPVQGDRKLVLMEPSEDMHTYLFSDKLLEIYQLQSKKTRQFQLNIGRVQQASRLVVHGTMIGLVLDGRPRAFQLSGAW